MVRSRGAGRLDVPYVGYDLVTTTFVTSRFVLPTLPENETSWSATRPLTLAEVDSAEQRQEAVKRVRRLERPAAAQRVHQDAEADPPGSRPRGQLPQTG